MESTIKPKVDNNNYLNRLDYYRTYYKCKKKKIKKTKFEFKPITITFD